MIEPGVLIPVLAFIAVMCLGAALLSGGIAYRRTVKDRLYGYKGYDAEPTASNRPFLARLVGRVGTTTWKKETSSDLRKSMARAGYHGDGPIAVYLGSKVIFLMVGLVGGAAIAYAAGFEFRPTMFTILALSGVLFFLPNLFVSLKSASRTAEVRRHFPDAVDLLEISISGGMGLDQAWNSVTEHMQGVCPLLADEMALTNLEIHLGRDRADAMRHMGERTGADEISSLVAVLIQSERFGTSVSDALRVFTTSMREDRSQRAEEHAEKMAVKMIFPMVTLIFPALMIVAVGPAGITITELFMN